MARIYRQHGDAPEVIEEAKAACPVNCIKDINFEGLVKAEQERRTQAINNAGRLTQRAEKMHHPWRASWTRTILNIKLGRKLAKMRENLPRGLAAWVS